MTPVTIAVQDDETKCLLKNSMQTADIPAENVHVMPLLI